MDFSRRLDPLELDVGPDDELPGYEPQTAPTYESRDYDAPLYTYQLRQFDRKVQMFLPAGTSVAPSYRVLSHGAFRLFSKKPEITVMRASDAHAAEDSIASISFDNDGPLPWRPRAHFCHTSAHGTGHHAMESKNFEDWTVVIGGITFVWLLEARPVSLVLSEKLASLCIARFTYSRSGTMATGGAEVGDLTIYRDGLSVDSEGVEKIICSLVVPLCNFKKMGRIYRNDASSRATSLTREHLPSHRASFASYSTL